MQYPVTFKCDDTGWLVIFLDFPTACAKGKTRKESLLMADKVLMRTLSTYFKKRKVIPEPTVPTVSRDEFINVQPSVAAKILLCNALIRTNTTNTELGKMMRIPPQEVQKIVSLDHPTEIDTLEKALKVLGYHLLLSTFS